jgi:hypothetical protein
MHNRVFFPQAALDQWLDEGRIELATNQLVVRADGRKYRIVEAVRVMAELSGGGDAHDLVGRVKTVPFLSELGAELLDTSMVIGDLAYDVVPGFIGTPVGSFEQHRTSGQMPTPVEAQSDEELLAQFLIQHLE